MLTHVLAIGRLGIATSPPDALRVDTDATHLRAGDVLLGLRGLGAGGCAAVARGWAGRQAGEVAASVGEDVLVVAGVGGGTGGGATPTLARALVGAGKRVRVLAVTPMIHEGVHARDRASDALAELRADGIEVVVVSGEACVGDGDLLAVRSALVAAVSARVADLLAEGRRAA